MSTSMAQESTISDEQHYHTPTTAAISHIATQHTAQQLLPSMLKPLLLPQLVEERRQRQSLLDAEMNVSQSSDLQESPGTDISSPPTPTFSTRGHVRYCSSVSSIDIHSPEVDNSPSSPTFAAMKTSKRSLPDVQEEPHEREGGFDTFDDLRDVYDWSCDANTCSHHESSMAQSSVQLSMKPDFEYDLTDGFVSDTEFGLNVSKKRRAGDSPFSVIANRFGTRFPAFSRKWRSRKGSNPPATLGDSNSDPRASHTASSRSSSLSNSVHQALAPSYGETQMPPTPALSEFDRHDESSWDSEDVERPERDDGDRQRGFASTPLLPPLMMGDDSADSDVPVQSPLQSPSVAEPSEPATGFCTPIAGIATPSLRGIPSPPLSTKPSMSSIRWTHPAVPAHLLPSAEIPPMVIADIDDKWSNDLGHANFTIQPQPYLPDFFDLAACRQMKQDWDLARCNYTKHLVRTGEHYGVTSKTFQLTEAKWRATDAVWRRNNDATIANTAATGADAFATLKHKRISEGDANVMTKIPSLNDLRSEGKFPQLGDEDIVGPMVQATAQLQRNPSKKAKLMRFFAEKFPAGFGRSGA